MDEDWGDRDPSEAVDLDITGDPQLDQFGYQSPRRDMRPPPAPEFDYLAQYRRDQEARERRRAAVRANIDETKRRRNERRGAVHQQRPEPVAPVWHPQPTAPPVPQHGAYFEVRTRRVWWAPWRKKQTWTQMSTWHVGGPPAAATVVTVPDVGALPGQVHTIGTVGPTGAVEW